MVPISINGNLQEDATELPYKAELAAHQNALVCRGTDPQSISKRLPWLMIIEQKVAFDRVEPLLKMFRLDQRWTGSLFISKGMKQKVMIICAFVVDPRSFIVGSHSLVLIR